MRVLLVLGWLLVSFIILTPLSYATESDTDRLLELLVQKKVITQEDATAFRADLAIKKQEEKQPASVPDWVANTKLKGDFRVRYEWDKDKGQQDNSRARIRARIGVESKINNKLKLAVGVATGATNDPRSRNITLGSDSNQTNVVGSPKTIVLDYAYAQYAPNRDLLFGAGKILNPLWEPYQVFWKDEITPDGFGLNLNHKLLPKLSFFMNDLAYFMKNDSRTDKQIFLLALQPGLNWEINEGINLKSALTYNQFFNLKGANAFNNVGTRTNTGVSGSGTSSSPFSGEYSYNYDSIKPTAELSLKNPFSGLLPYAAIFGDYIYNVSLADSDATGKSGYDIGLKFGSRDVTDWGQWRTRLVYSKLGRDAWLDIFTDNNRYGGQTNTKAYEVIFDYGLGKNTWVTLHYYYAEKLTQPRNPEDVFQVDWNMKF